MFNQRQIFWLAYLHDVVGGLRGGGGGGGHGARGLLGEAVALRARGRLQRQLQQLRAPLRQHAQRRAARARAHAAHQRPSADTDTTTAQPNVHRRNQRHKYEGVCRYLSSQQTSGLTARTVAATSASACVSRRASGARRSARASARASPVAAPDTRAASCCTHSRRDSYCWNRSAVHHSICLLPTIEILHER